MQHSQKTNWCTGSKGFNTLIVSTVSGTTSPGDTHDCSRGQDCHCSKDRKVQLWLLQTKERPSSVQCGQDLSVPLSPVMFGSVEAVTASEPVLWVYRHTLFALTPSQWSRHTLCHRAMKWLAQGLRKYDVKLYARGRCASCTCPDLARRPKHQHPLSLF